MKLSVVIPVYNGADFIEKSYHSILSQQIQDFELIYVDNNSQDSSVECIKKLVQLDSRVSLLAESKQGSAAARNTGIKHAQGDYVYIFDVDDEIYPNALNKMIQVLDAYPETDAVFGKMVKSHQGISESLLPNDNTLKVVLKEKPYWGLKWFSNLKFVVGPPAFLYRSSVFNTIGFYNEDLRLGQDTALDIKLGMMMNIAFLDMYVYLYLKHGTSTTDTVKKKTPRAFMVWPRLVKEHLPFYLEQDTPLRFKSLLFSQLFQSMGRQVVFTKGLKNRQDLKQQLYHDLQAIQIPLVIRLYLSILVILPLESLRKVYGYYMVPYVVKQLTN
ncbi:glycosyltransferase family 2 protein [Bizionia sp.]|uniref:glycosyltransferase family 2 protein n=1 Tax=Bizionia sp. TaxID=1954480 RepID=UPI003A95DC9C